MPLDLLPRDLELAELDRLQHQIVEVAFLFGPLLTAVQPIKVFERDRLPHIEDAG